MASAPNPGYLDHLFAIVESRKKASPDESYIARIFAKGRRKIAQKVGEEGVETALAAVGETRADVISESADLLFHMLILWAECDIRPQDVLNEMQRREGISGLDEKKQRKEK